MNFQVLKKGGKISMTCGENDGVVHPEGELNGKRLLFDYRYIQRHWSSVGTKTPGRRAYSPGRFSKSIGYIEIPKISSFII
jgi:hypothetical protein